MNFPQNAIKLKRIWRAWPLRPRYRVLRNGVALGVLEARRDKTSPRVLGQYPFRYRVVGEEREYDLPGAIKRLVEIRMEKAE
jgi:hypothetical protein